MPRSGRGPSSTRSSAIRTPASRHLRTMSRCQSTVNHSRRLSAMVGPTPSTDDNASGSALALRLVAPSSPAPSSPPASADDSAAADSAAIDPAADDPVEDESAADVAAAGDPATVDPEAGDPAGEGPTAEHAG